MVLRRQTGPLVVFSEGVAAPGMVERLGVVLAEDDTALLTSWMDYGWPWWYLEALVVRWCKVFSLEVFQAWSQQVSLKERLEGRLAVRSSYQLNQLCL